MAINIKHDLIRNPEPPTIILSNKSGNKLGQLKVDNKSIDISDKLINASEFSFTINKYIDNKLTPLWDKIVNFKLVYCKEWDMWFEIKVELDEDIDTVKTVYCTQLGNAELSQIMLYNVEINTEKDIERDDYKISILYDEKEQDASILHRMLEKAPHYSIKYVDPTIARIQRSLSFDDKSIDDSFQEVGKEIGCLFVYPSNSGEKGKINRDIFVYDLQQNCNDCGHRGEFTDKCPKCGSTNIKYGYGKDTLIFVTADELASSGIQLVPDTDSVKNCFKIEAGDDLMTATVRSCNPNGSDYIWRFSDDIKEDMSDELVEKIESYDNEYKKYCNDYEFTIDADMLNNYNELVNKYSVYNKELSTISMPIKGYSSLMNAYYSTIDLSLYLKSGLMPSVEMSGTNAEEQAKLLTASALSPIAVADVTIVSLATANSAVLAMAKTVVKSTYKVEIKSSELVDEGNAKYWKGNFIVTSYSDDEDTAESNVIDLVKIVDNDETIIKQKIEKALNKENTDDLSISGLFKKDYDDFCAELKKYALNPLNSFYEACQSCIDILIEQGAGNNDTWSGDGESNLYENLYKPYYDKLLAIEAEIKIREDEINVVAGVYDVDGNLLKDGLQTYIERIKTQTQKSLDFEKYLGKDLWFEFCSYRREDKYTNDNYISDGLNNAELFKKAFEFFEVAQNEIYKSSELQYSISTTLNNLLSIEKFKPLVESFNLGNWIRVRIDDNIYKLRLLEYGIDFSDLNDIKVEFSSVTKIKNGITDVQDILSKASSMATSYGSIQRQADQGNKAKGTLDAWFENGLNSALVRIQSNNNEDITLTKNGLLCRSYDDITESYLPEQLKITHNIIAYTDDDWHTVRQAIGKHNYIVYDKDEKNFVDKIGYGMSADFVNAGIVIGSQIIGGDIYSDNYSIADSTGSYLNLRDGTFSFGGGSLRYEGGQLLISSPDVVTKNQITEINEEYLKTTTVYAENLQVGSANIQGKLNATQINTEGLIAENISSTTITGKSITGGSLFIGDKDNTYAEITTSGILNCSGANITGTINATSGVIGGCTIDEINVLQVPAANITGKLTVDNIDASGLKVDAASITGTLSAATISASNITAGANDEVITFNGPFTAPKATITGDITASTGNIGGWVVGDFVDGNGRYTNSLYRDTGNYRVFLRSDYSLETDTVLGIKKYSTADKSDGGSYTFYIQHDGYLVAKYGSFSRDITIGGRSISNWISEGGYINEIRATTGSVGGWNISSSYLSSPLEQHPWAPSGYYGQVRLSANSVSYGVSTSSSSSPSVWSSSYWSSIVDGANNSISDERLKRDIEEYSEDYDKLFDSLRPVKYKYINGTSDRYHTGFVAQEVVAAVEQSNLTTQDFAAVMLCNEGKEDEQWMLRRDEFVSLNTWQIQKLKHRVTELEEKIKKLEQI